MKRPPPDRELRKLIDESYYDDFSALDEDSGSRARKLYVPIDCVTLTEELGVDEDIVFGKRYDNLDKKYGYTQDDGARVHLFTTRLGSDRSSPFYPALCGSR